MRLPRMYVPGSLHAQTTITLDSRNSHYVLRVLRLRKGAQFIIFNGSRSEFLVELADDLQPQAIVFLKQAILNVTESPLKIHLGQGISRGEKMDFTIQKAVELGVDSITPIITEFTEVKLKEDRLEKRMMHWQGIIISACEQSGRNYLPHMQRPQKLSDWVRQCTESLQLVLHPAGERGLVDMQLQDKLKAQTVALLIGPEGGLSDQEVNLALKNDFQMWRFGPRILRTETAAIAALAALQSRWGDM